MPAIFVSHGSPLLAITDSAARRFLLELGPRLPLPRAVVVFSAHYDAPRTEVTAAVEPPTIHDFGGFPRELYEIVYRAPGEPALARRIAELLSAASIDAVTEPRRGLDHGAWIPLSLMYPEADVPALQVSIDSTRTPADHFALGRALRPLRDEGVLLLGSGGATHNLGLYARSRGRTDASAPPDFVAQFNEWVADAIFARRYDDLMRYRALAPHAAENHPTPDHFLPLFATLGAALDGEQGVRIHSSYDRGLLSLDAYAFGALDAPLSREIAGLSNLDATADREHADP
jgi:4,5-DOPA dioxygenase extradiol